MWEKLRDFGLNEKQARLYAAGLQMGQGSMSELAVRAGMKRPTAYVIMDELLARQLFVIVPQGRRKTYRPLDPADHLARQEDALRQAHLNLPQIADIFRAQKTQSVIRHIQGYRDIYKFYEDILRTKQVWSLFDPESYLRLFGHDETKHFFNIIKRHQCHLYDMIPNTPAARQFAVTRYQSPLCQTRILPKSFQLNAEILVTDHKMALIRFDTAFALVIEDDNIVSSMKSVLTNLWQSLAARELSR